MQRNQAARRWGSARCLWNALKKQDFPALDFPCRATTTPCEGEDGSRRKKCNSRCRATLIMSPYGLVRNVPILKTSEGGLIGADGDEQQGTETARSIGAG